MNGRNGKPPILAGCDVLPPLKSSSSNEPAGPQKPAQQRHRREKSKRRKSAGRFSVLNDFVDGTAGELARSEILVWLVLYRDCYDGTARTSQADIARRTGLAQRTIRWALRRLERRGLLVLVSRGGINRGPSSYRIRGRPPE